MSNSRVFRVLAHGQIVRHQFECPLPKAPTLCEERGHGIVKITWVSRGMHRAFAVFESVAGWLVALGRGAFALQGTCPALRCRLRQTGPKV